MALILCFVGPMATVDLGPFTPPFSVKNEGVEQFPR